MTPAKVKVGFAFFAYSGNGGVASTIPEISLYFAKAYYQMKTNPLVESVGAHVYCDTPITMTRNRAVRDAKRAGIDILIMLDSDNEPDAYCGNDPGAKPFLDVAFPFVYERLMKGEPTVIF